LAVGGTVDAERDSSEDAHGVQCGNIRPMKNIFIVCCFVLCQQSGFAIDISIGGTQLSIPAPAGYSPITSEMKPYAEIAKRFVPPSNEQYALFLPQADTAIAAKGGIPESERRFYVQTSIQVIDQFVSSAEFAELKRTIKAQNAEQLKKVEAQMPGMLQKMNKGISDDYNVNLNLSLNQMVPFAPHYETERGMAYSMLVKYGVNDAKGKPSVFEGVVTATFVHVRGKVLFLYANAEKSGLDWSRTECRKWAESVIAANPSTGDVADREKTARGFNWGRVGQKALIGGIVGGLFGAFGYIFKRKEKEEST
jgi:hypothetical protein